MRGFLMKSALVGLFAFGLAACTQDAAQVELKGQNMYGRIGGNASGSYVTSYGETTSSSAAVQPIGVSDLVSPSKTSRLASKTPASAPFKPSQTEAPKPATTLTPVHIWNSKSDEESLNIRPQGKTAIQEKPQMIAAVSKSDNVIGNETSSVKATPARIIKPVKGATVSGGNFMWPVTSKKVISDFGPKGRGKANDGINIASSDGEPVWAAADGEVVYVGNELKGYGNMVLIKHAGDRATTYAHMSRATVDKYDHVKQGDIIGYVGTTGSVKEPQLHFAIREGKEAVDPLKYFDRKVASLPQ